MNPLLLLLIALAHSSMAQRQPNAAGSRPELQGTKGALQGAQGAKGPIGAQRKTMTTLPKPTFGGNVPTSGIGGLFGGGATGQPSLLMQMLANRGGPAQPSMLSTRPVQ
jgi:hypothetical protein